MLRFKPDLRGSNDCEYQDAHSLFESKNFKGAFAIYKRLAEDGDLHCQTMIGWMYHEGLGTELNLEEAEKWFKAAANLGSKEASFYCGKSALRTRKYEEALNWFSKSAAQEYGPALFWLGKMQIRGLALEKDFEKGIGYLNRAAVTGNFPARRELAILMLTGKLGPLRILQGLAMFPYSIFAALATGCREGYTHKLMG